MNSAGLKSDKSEFIVKKILSLAFIGQWAINIPKIVFSNLLSVFIKNHLQKFLVKLTLFIYSVKPNLFKKKSTLSILGQKNQ